MHEEECGGENEGRYRRGSFFLVWLRKLGRSKIEQSASKLAVEW
jgi:hypothetical protein